MYAKQEDGNWKKYLQLPKEVFVNDEWVKLTPYNCDDYGFKTLVNPTYNARTHERTNTIIEDGDVCTFEVVSLNKTVDNLKKELLAELKSYWKTAFEEGKPYSDYLKATNQNMPSDVETEINAAYTMLGTLKAQIKGITTMEAALAFKFPESDINEKLDYMRELI